MAIKLMIKSVFIIVILNVCNALPPHQRLANEEYDKLEANEHVSPQSINLEQFGIEYQRYLEQVIEALESDPEFKKRLESASDSDIRSGKIAEELAYVSHHVRSKLDELKRIELDRLRQLARKQYELTNGKNRAKAPAHLDHSNPDTFEYSDLQKLIYQAAEDLREADRKRKELFKEYEMQKHFEREQKLSNMTDEERTKFLEHEQEEQVKKKTAQKTVHHPGSRQQLEEVWEKQDHLEKDEFNPKVFFAMHDLDNNGFLDEEEVKVLFINELNKIYGKSDLVERNEEMERMREHVFNDIDVNKDRLISWDEFYSMSMKPEFSEDDGWEPIDEQKVYTPEELTAFEKLRQVEIEKLTQDGKINAPHPSNPQNSFAIPSQQYNQIHQNPAYPHQEAYGVQNHQGLPQQAYAEPNNHLPQEPSVQNVQPDGNHVPVQQPYPAAPPHLYNSYNGQDPVVLKQHAQPFKQLPKSQVIQQQSKDYQHNDKSQQLNEIPHADVKPQQFGNDRAAVNNKQVHDKIN